MVGIFVNEGRTASRNSELVTRNNIITLLETYDGEGVASTDRKILGKIVQH